MNSALIVFFCLGSAVAVGDGEWQSFKAEFGRQYKSPVEEAFRKKIFLNNVMLIQQHNQRYAEGQTTFTMAINHFADLTNEEYNARLSHFQINENAVFESEKENMGELAAVDNVEAIVALVNWTKAGCVNPVKDQGRCGSCWAFSSIASIEFANCRFSGVLTRLSEQQLVDCSWGYGNQGCGGGWMNSAFKYVADNGGVDTEAFYPYSATNGSCKFNRAYVGGYVNGYVTLASGIESALQTAVNDQGVSVAIDAGKPSFQFYSGGVYNEPTCSTTQLNHAVYVTGYGNDNGVDFWIVKNSWSTRWGEYGYIRMSRNKSNQCGIATAASYAIRNK